MEKEKAVLMSTAKLVSEMATEKKRSGEKTMPRSLIECNKHKAFILAYLAK